MATPPNDDSRQLFKLLADGQWHFYEEIRDRLAAMVPPGRAIRKYDERVDYARRYKNDPDYDTSATEDDRIFYGQRACAQIAITSWKGRGLMFRGDGPQKEIRIKPGFKAWGIEVDTENDSPNAPQSDQDGQVVPEAPAEPPGASEAEQDTFLGDVEAFERELEADLAEELNQAVEQPVEQPVEQVAEEPEREPDPVHESTAEEDGYSWPRLHPVTKLFDHQRCEECGLLISDETKHAQWHERFIARSAEKPREDMALFAESEIRTLLEDVVGKVIDDFQAGMERYLAVQFAQLEALIRSGYRPPGKWRNER